LAGRCGGDVEQRLVRQAELLASTKASPTPIIEMPRIMLLQILAACPRRRRRNGRCVRPIGFKDRLANGEGLRRAAGHEGERAGRGAAGAAGDRRIERRQAVRRRRQGMRLARAVDVDGRGIDEQRALRRLRP
jgi:hypothetical protein